MAWVRCVTEMGMGVDVHGLDYTNAAKRAVFDALHHSSLVGRPTRRMRDSCLWESTGISEKSIFFDFIPFSFFPARPPCADDLRDFFTIHPLPKRIEITYPVGLGGPRGCDDL